MALLLAAVALVSVMPSPTRGATITWTGAVNTNWNLAGNWSPLTVPGAFDIAVVDGTSPNSALVNVNTTVGGIQISGGSITQGAGRTLSLGASGWSQSGGSFLGSAAAITVNGPFTLSGGTYTATSGILSLSSDLTVTAGTFAHNGGTLRFIGAAATIDLPGSLPVWNVTLAHNNATPKTLAAVDSLVVDGLLTLTNGTWEGGELRARGPIAAASGFDGGSGILRIDGDGDQLLTGTASASAGQLPNLVIDKLTGTLSLAGTIRTARDWTYLGGMFSAGTSTLILAGTETISTEGATLFRLQVRAGTATLVGTLSLASDLSVLGAIFDLDGNSVDVGGALTVTGTLIADGADLRVGRNVTASGSFQAGSGRLTLDGTVAQQINLGSSALHDLVVDNAAGAALVADLAVGGTLDLTAGTLAIDAHRLTIVMPIGGVATNLIGGASSALTIAGSAAGIVVPASVTDLAELQITNPVGTSIGGPLTLYAGLVLAGGKLDAGPYLVSIAAGGTVDRTSGHVIGRLQKQIPAGAPVSVTFEIGDWIGYAPVQASWEAVSGAGTVTASTAPGDDVAGLSAVGLVAAASVNRTWTIVSGSLAAEPTLVTFTYLVSDLDPEASPMDLRAAISIGGSSTLAPVTMRTATSTTVSLAGAPGGTVALAMLGADLDIQLIGPTTGLVGEPYSFLVSVTDAGPFDASAPSIEITLPASATRLLTTPSQGSCQLSGNVLSCDLGPIASGSSATVAVIVSFASPGSHQLTAAGTVGTNAIDPISLNDSATLDVAISQPTPSPSPNSPNGIGQLPDTSTPPASLVLAALSLAVLALAAVIGTMRTGSDACARSSNARSPR